jgi:hypothetical protein
MPQSNSPDTNQTGWVTTERRNWLALAAVCALLGYSAGNGHTTQKSVASISDRLGQARQEAGCEHWRAAKAIQLAEQPVIVQPGQIPKDCPGERAH